MMETEIWPNLLRACRRAGVKTVLVNGRISSRSYPRYRLARPFFRRVLRDVDRFCMQSEESARRIIEIGADPRAGDRSPASLKFDSLEIPGAVPRSRPQPRAALLPHSARAAGDHRRSTLKGEEEPVLEAFQRIRATWRNALLIIAPRKPERFDEVERLARQRGWNVARRNELRVDAEPRDDVVILDTIGELAQLYQIATRGVRRRQPGRRRRPQHPRAGGVRQADRLRSAHAELRRDRPHVPRERGAVQVHSATRARDRAARAARRSGAPRQPRRGRAGAGRSQSRRAAASRSPSSPSCCRRTAPEPCCRSAPPKCGEPFPCGYSLSFAGVPVAPRPC